MKKGQYIPLPMKQEERKPEPERLTEQEKLARIYALAKNLKVKIEVKE